jgi:hypothetical protein
VEDGGTQHSLSLSLSLSFSLALPLLIVVSPPVSTPSNIGRLWVTLPSSSINMPPVPTPSDNGATLNGVVATRYVSLVVFHGGDDAVVPIVCGRGDKKSKKGKRSFKDRMETRDPRTRRRLSASRIGLRYQVHSLATSFQAHLILSLSLSLSIYFWVFEFMSCYQIDSVYFIL